MTTLSAVRILSVADMQQVVRGLRSRARRSKSAKLNLTLFRLAACCGLRVKELTGITLANVKLNSSKPHIYIPADVAKGGRPRMVPLWWDEATLADIEKWRDLRVAAGAASGDPFLCGTRTHVAGKRMARRSAQARWERVIRSHLGIETAEAVSIHGGRHSFCSNALAGGRSLIEVRDAAGHASVATTNIYLHLATQDDAVGSLFEVNS